MKAYTIFDDFPEDAKESLESAGFAVTVHPMGVPRPDHDRMKAIMREYDCVIIGTSQKITEDMFDGIDSVRIIGTASVGTDHIKVPEAKRHLVHIYNAPKANGQSVAEYTIACALSCVKRLDEGRNLYMSGHDNKSLHKKPEDLLGKTIGVIGAGNISARIMDYARFFGMRVVCWTRNPAAHVNLAEKGTEFTSLEYIAENADVISVNLPNKPETKKIISADFVAKMKPESIFISVSRIETLDLPALIAKADSCPGFYVCLDLDVDPEVAKLAEGRKKVFITPHIASGTVETRKRLFREASANVAKGVMGNLQP